MDRTRTQHNLFEVYLRLRPPPPGAPASERILTVEEPETSEEREQRKATGASHITLNPPTDRRRAIEKFGFTRVFEEEASQLDVFHCAEVVPLVEGVIAPAGGEGTDAMVATLGVTGSGKTHTILGSKSQRGLTQLALDVLFNSIGQNMIDGLDLALAADSLQACDASEASLVPAANFIEAIYSDGPGARSRAATPAIVRTPELPCTFPESPSSPQSVRPVSEAQETYRLKQRWQQSLASSPLSLYSSSILSERTPRKQPSKLPQHFMNLTAASRVKNIAKSDKGESHGILSPAPAKRNMTRPSALPQTPDVSGIDLSCDPSAEYAIVVSMYEVHNDRIYDLLAPPVKSIASKDVRRRPLLFKATELSPDRKVVAGLRKVICSSFRESIMVLEAGLQERRVAGTGSNSVSSRSHGFFCFEVKKRARSRRPGPWGGSKLTIVDLAGSERARDAKTAGATLVEAGKINESLMYLGQCLQTQSEVGISSKPNIVPYRQCKLTELLFSNSFPSSSSAAHPQQPRRNPQRGVMIVTADPLGDFNATSQILRYSALAREVTVPRIPSITATIFANTPSAAGRPVSPVQTHHPRPFMPPGSSGSYRQASSDERATMELAALEIARLSDDIDHLRDEVEHQTDARMTAEAHLLSMEDRMLELEEVIRDECATEFEQRLNLELARFKASLALEQERNEEHWDKKVDVLERGLDMPDSDDEKENVLVENLEEEVERLRRENGILRRELTGRSPSKRRPLEEREDYVSSPQGSPSKSEGKGVAHLGRKLEKMRVSTDSTSSSRNVSGSPGKKTRRLGAKKWEHEEEMD